MRIFVLGHFPRIPSGLSALATNFANGLARLGQDVEIGFFAEEQTYERLKRFKPDVVLSIGFWGWNPQLLERPKRMGFKVVPFYVPDGVVGFFQDIMKEADLLIVPSEITREVYARDGYPADRIRKVHLGIDPNLFTPHFRWSRLELARDILGRDRPIIFSFWSGENPREKDTQGVENMTNEWRLVEAAPRIKEEIPNFILLFKVYGNKAHLPLLRKRARELGVEENVKVLDFNVDYETLPALYNAFCDIYASMPPQAGFEFPYIEVMACAKPCVVGDWSPGNEIVVDGETGRLVKCERETDRIEVGPPHMPYAGRVYVLRPLRYFDIDDYVRKVIPLLTDPELRRRMGLAGRERVKKCFEITKQSEKLLAVLEEVV